jgi:hypothetical protein
MTPDWIAVHPGVTPEHLGFLPGMLDDGNPAPAREQLDRGYQHGGGWRPFQGHTLTLSLKGPSLVYPGDPPMLALAMTRLRDETIVLFQHDWVAIIQKDRSFEVCRMD